MIVGRKGGGRGTCREREAGRLGLQGRGEVGENERYGVSD